MDEPVSERRLHLCEPGWDPPLLAELLRVFPQSKHGVVQRGLLSSELTPADSTPLPCLAFAGQCLPKAVAAEAQSVSQWAKQVGDFVLDRLRDHDANWRLHVFPHFGAEGPAGFRRCQLIRAAALERLKQKRRRLLRLLYENDDSPWQADESLVQLALAGPNSGWLSLAAADDLWRLRRCLSRFPGGVVPLAQDRAAPSRAFQKLAEVERRLGQLILPDETCVDLGSSPGSWAWLALSRGARVTAVDRSPLRDDLMVHPHLTFAQGDAFQFVPPGRADWLLCDVIAFPERTAELLADWLKHDRCRRFCVTIKFRGRDDDAILEPLKQMLASSGREFCLRRLSANKNEVTAYGGPAEKIAGTKQALC